MSTIPLAVLSLAGGVVALRRPLWDVLLLILVTSSVDALGIPATIMEPRTVLLHPQRPLRYRGSITEFHAGRPAGSGREAWLRKSVPMLLSRETAGSGENLVDHASR